MGSRTLVGLQAPSDTLGVKRACVLNYIDRQLSGPLQRFQPAYHEGLSSSATSAMIELAGISPIDHSGSAYLGLGAHDEGSAKGLTSICRARYYMTSQTSLENNPSCPAQVQRPLESIGRFKARKLGSARYSGWPGLKGRNILRGRARRAL